MIYYISLGSSIVRFERNLKRKTEREKRLAKEQREKDEALKKGKKVKKKAKEIKKRDVQVRMNYKEDLEDFRWIRKRKRIFKRDNYTCQECGATTNLQVHHKKYISGRRPWQYNEAYLITLCTLCHGKHHLPEIKAKTGNKLLDKEFENITN